MSIITLCAVTLLSRRAEYLAALAAVAVVCDCRRCAGCWLVASAHGRRQGGARGCTCTPLEFENGYIICCLQAKYNKIFARASGGRTE